MTATNRETVQQGNLVELEITGLSSRGDGVGHIDGMAVFVPDTVPGDRAKVRIVSCKRQYAHGKLQAILAASADRIRARCIVADKCGGCQWQHIDFAYQRQAKHKQVIETLKRVGGFRDPAVAPLLFNQSDLGYRNKVTYPLKRSSSGKVQAGYYRRNSHQLVNLNQCPVQDQRLNPLLAEVKQDIEERGWSIYQESLHQGKLRHLSLRIGRRTGEKLLTLVSTDPNLPNLSKQAQEWLNRYPQLIGVCLNHHPAKSNKIFGDQTHTVVGQPYLREVFANLQFFLGPDTFFQINTEVAELLLTYISDHLSLTGEEIILDAYCGIGTFTLPLAQQAKRAIGIEISRPSLTQAMFNAKQNQIHNVSWIAESVEKGLNQLPQNPDVVILDPPRQGCKPAVLEKLLILNIPRIVYVSCQPATLARDLKYLCSNQIYRLKNVITADFFPQTPHVESAAFLERD